MPITKRTEIDLITVDPSTGLVCWRETTYIEEDGQLLTKSGHRSSREIIDDTPMPAEAKRVRDLFDTPAMRKKFLDKRAADLAKITHKP